VVKRPVFEELVRGGAGVHVRRTGEVIDARKLPSEMNKMHTWRTREDPFVDVWPKVEEMLKDMPELTAEELFGWMIRMNNVTGRNWQSCYALCTCPQLQHFTRTQRIGHPGKAGHSNNTCITWLNRK